jgi:hypothetical protein
MSGRRANTGRRSGGTGASGAGGDHLDQLLRDDTDQDTDTMGDHVGRDDVDEPDDGDGLDTGDSDSGNDTDDADEPDSDDGDPGSRPATIADVERAAQRIADRTVNAVLRRLSQGSRHRDQQDRSQDGDQGRDRGRQHRDSDGDSDRDESRSSTAATREDTREARMAYREYFGDQHKTIDSSEREIANGLAGTIIAAQLAEHGDPDRAGRHAAVTVTAQLKAFRRAVEKSTVAALRSRGALKDLSSSGGGSQPAGVAVTPTALADKRTAAKSRADRFNTELGYTSTTGQQTG